MSLDNGSTCDLHRFALVGKNDFVQFSSPSTVNVFVPAGSGSSVVVSPPWSMNRTIEICGNNHLLSVKEIETTDELRGYEALVRHHYRTGAGPSRRALLVAKIVAPDLPPVCGFVEICSSFLVNVPRKKILDTAFRDSVRGACWRRWDLETAKRYTNATARISRCVVYPELRGIGVAGVLAEAAKLFAADRWHIGGMRPSFLEITAEMLRYWPFVRPAGFIHVGDTQGNGDRLEKSMVYLLERKQSKRGYPRGGGGILSLYRSQAELLDATMTNLGWSVQDVVERLQRSPEELTTEDWVSLHGLYRRPKPVYMSGLTADAETHLARVLQKERQKTNNGSLSRRDCKLVIQNLTIRTSWRPDRSREAREIQEAFNIVAATLDTVTTTDLNVDLRGGTIVLVKGASGSGKSLLLRALAWHASGTLSKWRLPEEIETVGCMQTPPMRVAMMSSTSSRKSPISLLVNRGLSLTDAMRLLASAGLAEARLFVRPSRTLSTGQRYRLGLALALSQRPDLLLVDEFCESLDKYSAAAVCRRLRRATTSQGMIAIVASINGGRIASELQPDVVLQLLPNGWHRWEEQ